MENPLVPTTIIIILTIIIVNFAAKTVTYRTVPTDISCLSKIDCLTALSIFCSALEQVSMFPTAISIAYPDCLTSVVIY